MFLTDKLGNIFEGAFNREHSKASQLVTIDEINNEFLYGPHICTKFSIFLNLFSAI